MMWSNNEEEGSGFRHRAHRSGLYSKVSTFERLPVCIDQRHHVGSGTRGSMLQM